MAMPPIPGFTSGGSMAIDTGASGRSGDIADSGRGGSIVFGPPVYNYGNGNRTTPAAQGWQQYIPLALMVVAALVLVKAVK